MLLTDYVRLKDGTGMTVTELHQSVIRLAAGDKKKEVSWKTVIKAATHGRPVAHETAEKLSAATGGRCSPDEIKDPRRFMTARQRAEFESRDRLRARSKTKRGSKKAA